MPSTYEGRPVGLTEKERAFWRVLDIRAGLPWFWAQVAIVALLQWASDDTHESDRGEFLLTLLEGRLS